MPTKGRETARGGPQTGRRYADLTRKPGGGTLTPPANEKAARDAYSASGADDLHHERLPQGQAATVQAVTRRPHPQSAPKGARERAADLNEIPVTDWTQVRHTQAADCKRVSTVRAVGEVRLERHREGWPVIFCPRKTGILYVSQADNLNCLIARV